MKKWAWTAVILGILGVPAGAQTDAVAQPASGKIIIYRPGSLVGAALGCPIRYKGIEIVELGRNKYAEWQVPAGRYILTNKTSSIQVIVEAGEYSYVRCVIKTGFMSGRADLQLVDEVDYRHHASDFQRKAIVNPLGTGR